MRELETDYLIVGAGASGMAFTDALVTNSDADVTMVDRRHRPGGHWNDAYPFVRLHQPSANYGVTSRELGNGAIDEVGPNAGYYERASAAEVCDYYQRVLDEQLRASGQVRFFGMCDYVTDRTDGHQFVSRLNGETTTVRVRRRLVDATHLESPVPATHTPKFEGQEDASLVTPNELVGLPGGGSGFTVIGAGKTSMDTCTWLLDNDVPPEAIRWIRPRDPWTLDRALWQPRAQLPRLVEGFSWLIEASAGAEDIDDLFRRLESCGTFVRLDPEVEPDTFRGATLSQGERDRLRQIEDVVRLGRVRRLEHDQIVLDDGSIPTDSGQVHVDCTAPGVIGGPVRPVFEADRITLQAVQWYVLPCSAAQLGFVEARWDDDVDKNRLCPPVPPLNQARDFVRAFHLTQRSEMVWGSEPELATWRQACRLNPAQAVADHLEDARMQSALARLSTHAEAATSNLERLLARAR